MPLTDLGRQVVAHGPSKAVPKDSDYDYVKAVSLELVFAWQDATSPDVRAALERVMWNVGVEPDGDGGWTMTSRHPGGRYKIA